MQQVHTYIADSPLTVDEIALAVCLCENLNYRHAGLVHRNHKSGELHLLELCGHLELANGLWETSGYFWVVPDLEPLQKRQISGAARKIWRANGRYVPYGISHPDDCFDKRTGAHLFGSTRSGLTCATLVLGVFEYADIWLIDYDSWQYRQDDADWQDWVCQQLERGGAPQQEINARRREEIDGFRYRPEEVFAAGVLYPPSTRFRDARRVGEEIVAQLINSQ